MIHTSTFRFVYISDDIRRTRGEAEDDVEEDETLVLLEVSLEDVEDAEEELPAAADHRQDDEALRRLHPLCKVSHALLSDVF